jgi:hypothetical protein
MYGIRKTTMKRSLICLTIFFGLFNSAMAQTQKEADLADVSSMDAIIKAVYDVISGEPGKPRDWDRFRSLFQKDGRLIPSGKNPRTGLISATALSPEDYIKRSEPFLLKEGFFEREVARHTDAYGNIAQVFSTYESRHLPVDKTPFARGINSFQLYNDGKRWWILTIFWEAESPEHPLPKEFLRSRK